VSSGTDHERLTALDRGWQATLLGLGAAVAVELAVRSGLV